MPDSANYRNTHCHEANIFQQVDTPEQNRNQVIVKPGTAEPSVEPPI